MADITITPIDIGELYDTTKKVIKDLRDLKHSISMKPLKEDINNIIIYLNRTSLICAEIIGQSEAYEIAHKKLVIAPADQEKIKGALNDLAVEVDIVMDTERMKQFMGQNSAAALGLYAKKVLIKIIRSEDDLEGEDKSHNDKQSTEDFIAIVKKIFELVNQIRSELNKAVLNA
jgi:hypothetical protein